MLKGYWQVPLTERAKKISAFVTPNGLYQYKVMPFGMKNAGATYQRMINKVIAGLRGCRAYIDDICAYNFGTFKEHLVILEALFDRLLEAVLTANLSKSVFCQATVSYLGFECGQGKIRPIQAKVEVIALFPVPSDKKKLMRFLGMAGFYRRFCPNFSTVAYPLTNLLADGVKYIWSEQCDIAFEKIKAILQSFPVLVMPDYTKEFKLYIDASDVGCGGVLMQEVDGIDHPIG